MTLCHHCMTHLHKSQNLEEILSHTTINQIRYLTYNLALIQTQVHQILLHNSHLTHQTTSIINEDDKRKSTKRNTGVKVVLVTQSKITQILQPNYLHPRANQRSLGSNGKRILYSTEFISYPS